MDPAATLGLKLVLTPLLIASASLAGRRWGSEIGGWLLGIPFTSGPIAFFLALHPGVQFAAAAAAGILGGAASQAAFCLAYAWAAQRANWVAALVAGTVAFGAATVLMEYIAAPPPIMFAAMLAVLGVALLLMPRSRARTEPIDFPRWDLPARMLVATAFVVVLTAIAPLLGARLAGLLAPYPLYAGVLAIFAHRLLGPAPAVAVLRGLLIGLFAFASFFFALTELLVEHGVAVAFAIAIGVALLVQGASLAAGTKLRAA